MDSYITKRRISEEGFSREFLTEELEKVQWKLFGKWPFFAGRTEEGDQGLTERKEGPVENWERCSSIYLFGVTFSRPGTDLKTRGLFALSALLALDRQDIVRIWINACLNLGWTEDEVLEIIIFASYFAGFPVMRVHLLMLFDILDKRKADPNTKVTAAYLPWSKPDKT